MNRKEIGIVGVAVAGAVAMVAVLAYAYNPQAQAYGMYNQGAGLGYGMMGGMMQGANGMMSTPPSQFQRSSPSQAQPRSNAQGGMGMMGDMMGGGSHMGGMSNATDFEHCTNYMAGDYTGNMVMIGDYRFIPQTLKVKVGTTVTWVNMDGVAHSVESGTHQSPTSLFKSELLNRMQSYSYTFTRPGTYIYHCDPHPEMTGTIIVEE